MIEILLEIYSSSSFCVEAEVNATFAEVFCATGATGAMILPVSLEASSDQDLKVDRALAVLGGLRIGRSSTPGSEASLKACSIIRSF